MKNKDRKFLGVSLVFGFLSAACCILPIFAALFGLSYLSVLAVKLEKFRWLFIWISILFIGATGYWLYQEKKKCTCLSKKKLIILAITTAAILVFILFPYILSYFLSINSIFLRFWCKYHFP